MFGSQPPILATSFKRYTAVLADTGWAPSGELDAVAAPLSLSIRIGRQLVPKFMRDWVKSTLTRAVAPVARRRAAALASRAGDLRLHLGCGPNHLRGWVNVDLVSTGADLAWDLSVRAPFADGSVAAIFHEHLLEHLPLPAAVSFLQECHRLLRPGGVLRVGVPDFGRYARDYAGERTLIAHTRPGRPTALLAVSELAFCYGHASMWDEETLLAALKEAGFTITHVRGFGDSAIQPVPDSRWREAETLYVEAMKA